MKYSWIYPLYSLSRLWDEAMQMHKPDLKEIEEPKGSWRENSNIRVVGVDRMAKMEDEEVAKRAAAGISVDDLIAYDINVP